MWDALEFEDEQEEKTNITYEASGDLDEEQTKEVA